MKILLANKYFFIQGGADNSFFETARLLEKHGHQVAFFSMKHPKNFQTPFEPYFISNVDYERPDVKSTLKAAGRLLYSFEARRKIGRLIRKEKPDIAHLNSIYHQISPSILHTLRANGVPIVMTLRDFKMVCASYSMLAGGSICEACRNQKYFNCLLKKCVRDSRVKSLLNTIEMYLHHKLLNIYGLVDRFISPSRFLIAKMYDMGFKAPIEYLPNCTSLAESAPTHGWTEKSAIYFGRLSKEKGLETLITAFKNTPEIGLKIIGSGPLEDSLRNRVRSENITNIRFLGFMAGEPLWQEVRKSMFVALPSECYENNPRTIIEGFALGKPAIGSRIGGIPELVLDGKTGYTYEMGNPDDFKDKIRLLTGDPSKIEHMGRNARLFLDTELNTEKHYGRLMEIYQSVLNKK